MSSFYRQGALDALIKLGVRKLPPIRSEVRSENEPMIQGPGFPAIQLGQGRNPFDEFDAADPRKARRKTAAGLGMFKNISGTKNVGMPAMGAGMNAAGGMNPLKAPRPAMPSAGGVRMPKPAGAVDPRAAKPPGMNLQHQVQENAHAFDTMNSMTSPQRRFVSPI